MNKFNINDNNNNNDLENWLLVFTVICLIVGLLVIYKIISLSIPEEHGAIATQQCVNSDYLWQDYACNDQFGGNTQYALAW